MVPATAAGCRAGGGGGRALLASLGVLPLEDEALFDTMCNRRAPVPGASLRESWPTHMRAQLVVEPVA